MDTEHKRVTWAVFVTHLAERKVIDPEVAMLGRQSPMLDLLQSWRAAGRGVCIYQNVIPGDLGADPKLGRKVKVISCGDGGQVAMPPPLRVEIPNDKSKVWELSVWVDP